MKSGKDSLKFVAVLTAIAVTTAMVIYIGDRTIKMAREKDRLDRRIDSLIQVNENLMREIKCILKDLSDKTDTTLWLSRLEPGTKSKVTISDIETKR